MRSTAHRASTHVDATQERQPAMMEFVAPSGEPGNCSMEKTDEVGSMGPAMKLLIAAMVILLAAILLGLEYLAYSMYALIAVIGVSRLLAHGSIDHVAATRECNQLSAEIGDTVAVLVKVRNTGRLPIPWLLLEDLLPRHALIHRPPSLAVTGRRMQVAMLRSGRHETVLYQLECNRRGYFQLGPLVIETGDLFGFYRRWRIGTEPHFLLVYPRVVPLDGYEISSRRPIGEVRMSYRLFEDPTRIAGVRQYERGDPLNRVHWRATARTGLLHSKVYEPSTVAGATLLLEFHQAAYEARDEPHRSELAVTATASVAHALYQMGQQIGFVTNGRDAADRIRVEGWNWDLRTRATAQQSAAMRETSDRLQPVIVDTRRGHEQIQRILEALARIELTDGLDFMQLVSEVTSRLPRDATVIAVLPQVTMSTAIVLGSLKKQGYAVTAILNVYESVAFADAAGPLLAQGIATHHLRDEASIATVCRRLILR